MDDGAIVLEQVGLCGKEQQVRVRQSKRVKQTTARTVSPATTTLRSDHIPCKTPSRHMANSCCTNGTGPMGETCSLHQHGRLVQCALQEHFHNTEQQFSLC